MFWLFKKRKLLQIGPCVVIDPEEVTAMYPEQGSLVIRFSGIGIMRVSSYELYTNLEETVRLVYDKAL